MPPPITSPLLIAMESSCDDTAIAVMRGTTLLSHVAASQEIHATYGGVVPEYAARAHQRYVVPLVEEALIRANTPLTSLDAIAFTQGPGLLGSLLVGSSFAKGLAYALGKPLVGVHHVQAHLLANYLSSSPPKLPALGLVVSGGHTQLIWVETPRCMQVVGSTRDDAVGEAFDKIATMLGFSYPGGQAIDNAAQKGNPTRYTFPIANVPHFDFSFSGIKTAVRYFLHREKERDPHFVECHLHDLCASIQAALVEMLLAKVIKAMTHYSTRSLILGGGVAANTTLRKTLEEHAQQQHWQLSIPPKQYCLDNAAMIGITAYYHLRAGEYSSLTAVPDPRMPLPNKAL